MKINFKEMMTAKSQRGLGFGTLNGLDNAL